MPPSRGRKPRSEPSPLDFFVLVLVGRGQSTPYLLQQEGGVPAGAAIPSLRWLESKRLVRRGEVGSRGKQEFTLTPTGTATIRRLQSLQLDRAGHADLESVLRLTALAAAIGGKNRKRSALELIRKAIKQRQDLARQQSLPDITKLDWSNPGETYRWMRGLTDQSRTVAEVRALSHLVKVLRRFPPK